MLFLDHHPNEDDCAQAGAQLSMMYAGPVADPVEDPDQVYVNAAGTGRDRQGDPGFGQCFATTIATDEPHKINAPFTLERYQSTRQRLID